MIFHLLTAQTQTQYRGVFPVPVIVVFTKLDRLEFREQKRIKKMYVEQGMDGKSASILAKNEAAAAAASAYETTCVKVLESDLVPRAWTSHCSVSNKRELALLWG